MRFGSVNLKNEGVWKVGSACGTLYFDQTKMWLTKNRDSVDTIEHNKGGRSIASI